MTKLQSQIVTIGNGGVDTIITEEERELLFKIINRLNKFDVKLAITYFETDDCINLDEAYGNYIVE